MTSTLKTAIHLLQRFVNSDFVRDSIHRTSALQNSELHKETVKFIKENEIPNSDWDLENQR